MNIFQKISLLFKVKGIVEDGIKEIQTMDTASGKSGWKTTEFYGKIVLQLVTLWSAVKGFVPPQYAITIGASLEALYGIYRTVAKAVSDIQAAKSQQATVTTSAPVTTITTPA